MNDMPTHRVAMPGPVSAITTVTPPAETEKKDGAASTSGRAARTQPTETK